MVGGSYSHRFLQGDVVITVRALDFLPNGMWGKLDVFLAEEAGHFEKIWFAQGDSLLAMRTGNYLPKVLGGKPDMSAAGRT